MRIFLTSLAVFSAIGFGVIGMWSLQEAQAAENENPQIDYPGFVRQVQQVAEHREKRRISEDEFLKMIKDPDTVLMDARSKSMYELLHVEGAVSMPLPDITEEELTKRIPNKETRIVIYCNNNFKNAPVAFAPKAPMASLNLNTYNQLYSYGYRNIYELKPLLDRKTTRIPFAGKLAGPENRQPLPNAPLQQTN